MATIPPTTKRFILFLILNFAALGLGGLMMGEGPAGEWYQNLNRAPWTPPGWVFGASWFTIMICFAVYMANAYEVVTNRSQLLIYYGLQWVLNVAWNPAFFAWHRPWIALVIIVALAVLVAYFVFGYRRQLGNKVLWAAPYLVWLVIATSLNAYACLNN